MKDKTVFLKLGVWFLKVKSDSSKLLPKFIHIESDVAIVRLDNEY
jgi:hypothetical protein